MAELIKCKSCGFVMETSGLKDVCPACGVPAKMFEPFTDPVSDKRRMILGMHIHPIIVHFPQAFGAALFLLSAAVFFIQGQLRMDIFTASKVMAFFLPVVLVLSFITGIFDGAIRFRKIKSPYLIVKIIWAVQYLILSVVFFAVLLKWGYNSTTSIAVLTLVGAGMLASSTVLGIIGTKLLDAKFPG